MLAKPLVSAPFLISARGHRRRVRQTLGEGRVTGPSLMTNGGFVGIFLASALRQRDYGCSDASRYSRPKWFLICVNNVSFYILPC